MTVSGVVIQGLAVPPQLDSVLLLGQIVFAPALVTAEPKIKLLEKTLLFSTLTHPTLCEYKLSLVLLQFLVAKVSSRAPRCI